MNYILHQNQDGSLGITIPTGEVPLETVIKNDLPPNALYKLVSDLNNIDNEFFTAYNFDQELGAKIDIKRAKEIQKNKFRAARKPILEKLDVEFIKALETGNTQKVQEIATKKQELRDVTNTPLPDNLEGIKNTWPEILNG